MFLSPLRLKDAGSKAGNLGLSGCGFDILLEKKLSGVAEQGYTAVYGTSRKESSQA